ncbi:MAG: molecular chaperone HtpG [Anaerovoracaceae bacterium]
MAKRQFKAESKKLLDMMINSIYTHKEIFLRELISNASDALDKMYYEKLQSGDTGVKRSDFKINITADKDSRTLTISDNGIGMTKEELEENLGTIAKSGSQSFKDELNKADSGDSADSKNKAMTDIIGQFGVGFYSSFMVADKVTVVSKAYGQDEAYKWTSTGVDGYTVSPADKDGVGTDVILHLKEDAEGEDYSGYLEDYKIKALVQKYSDYIHYPIQMMMTKTRTVEDKDAEAAESENGSDSDEKKEPKTKVEEYQELETLNTMEPIWKRQKSKVKPEDYNAFYKDKYMDYEDPCRVIRTSVEGLSSYTALLFIPSHVPFDYYTKDYEKGLQLYSSGVLIENKCKELLPDYFNFVKGLVDTQDLSLNISRETLQHNRQVLNIEKNLEKKIKKELKKFMEEDREGYEKFFRNFGRQMKFGIYDDYGVHKDVLADLIMFYSSAEKKLVTLDEYISRMKDDQKCIYCASGETVDKIDMLPQTAAAKAKGYEVLYLTDNIDEFVVKMMHDYKDKEFKSVMDEDMNSASEDDKKKLKEQEEANKDLLGFVKDTLGSEVSEVQLSSNLAYAPCSLTSKGEISLEMEKTLRAMPNGGDIRAQRVFQLNPDHDVMKKLQDAYADGDEGREKAAVIIRLLYDQAELMSGLEINDPSRFSDDVNSLILGKKVSAEKPAGSPSETAETENTADGEAAEEAPDENPADTSEDASADTPESEN